jgi:transcriptional regulator with XRE-family HTH domain
MPNYSFADLLNIFFYLHQDSAKKKTQAELADIVQVSRRTMSNWFAGIYAPRSPGVVENLTYALCLTSFEADLLMYSVNPAWTKYGTPSEILELAEVIRYREVDVLPDQVQLQPVIPMAQIEREWCLAHHDTFISNYHRWGVGTKDNGMCQLQRRMENGSYVLSIQNCFHEDVFMGGDSSFLAPTTYCFTVRAKMSQGDTQDDGYGLMFEEISDECYAVFRIREKLHKASVVQTFDGGNNSNVYLRQVPAPAIRPKDTNHLAVLAIHQDHWFYVNEALVGHCVIPRLSCARLDVGIIAGTQQHVVCHFQDLRIYIPTTPA